MIKQKLNSIYDKIKGAIFLFIEHSFTYYTIKDGKLKMGRYIDFVVNQNIKALCKPFCSLFVNKRILRLVAERILSEYSELSDSTQLSDIKSANDRMGVFARKYEVLRLCGIVLTFDKDNKDVLEFLERSNIKGKNPVERIKNEMIMLEKKYKEVRDYIEQIETNLPKNKVSLSEYERVFQILNKSGYTANINMSVLSFIEAMKLYKQEVAENNKMVEKLKNRK